MALLTEARIAPGSALVIQGNALALPLPDASVDLICTSPPYFGLRSYQDGGQHYDGQIGSEATPAEFLDALLAATREMVRVLKPSGSIFVNLGDKYSTGNSGESGMAKLGEQYRGGGHSESKAKRRSAAVTGMRPKSLIGIPWRYAIRCIDELGLILRAEIIWAKPNGLPESVTDRVRRSHEQWFHFTKQPKYFAAVDEIREEYLPSHAKPGSSMRSSWNTQEFSGRPHDGMQTFNPNPLGKLPGSVWTIPTQPLTVPPELGVDHFAAYPMEWPRRIIQGWTPNGVCTACGQGRRPVATATAEYTARLEASRDYQGKTQNRWGDNSGSQGGFKWHPGQKSGETSQRTITGYVCGCPDATALTTPAVVLDPFGGTGTTALVAKALGRTGISVDPSSDYCRLATWRVNDPKQLERATTGRKPAKPKRPKRVPKAQPDLFEGA